MRKLINSTYITLDGVIQDPQDWPSLGSSSERGDQIQTDLLLSCDLQIMGRKSYESFAAAWPTRSADPLSDRMNAMPKCVFSSRVTDPAWENTTVIADLLRLDLVDDLRLALVPVLVGGGRRLFPDGVTARFHTAGVTALEHGGIGLHLRRP